MQLADVLAKLKSLSNPKDVEGMARFGINPKTAFGIRIPVLRKMAKEIGANHTLALKLWDCGYHAARILASMIDDVKQVDQAQMDRWVSEFNSWDVCDQCCMNLFVYHELARKKAMEWSSREAEFEKRAGFAMMATFAWKRKDAKGEEFNDFFEAISEQAYDNRNFVKKAVNWALRQIGKRNVDLNKKAIGVSKEIEKQESKAAKWIAKDALKELEGEAVQKRLSK